MTTSLFDAAITAAARQARAEKITVTAAKRALSLAYTVTKPLKLPTGMRMDEYGALFYDEAPGVAAFSEDNLLYAVTPQQIGNIRVQVGINDAREHVPAGPGLQGWSAGQKVNQFQLPLQRLTSITAVGVPQWAQADGPNSSLDKYLYPRLRLRDIEGRAAVTIELQRFAQQRAGS